MDKGSGSEPLHILLLEDSELDAEILRAMLDDDGIACEMTRVQTRADFVAALEQDGFDLILADYALPSFDGLLALEIARESRPDLPFILVSGALGEDIAIEAMKGGATDYVLKHRLERLVPAVRRALREAGERSERQRAEEELRESYTLLRSIVEGTPDAIFVKDAQGRYLMVNSACEEIAGKPAEEILGKDDTEVFAPEVARDLVESDRRVLVTGEALKHEKEIPVGGITRTYVTTRTAHRDHGGEVVGTIGVAHDITERKQAEEALNEVREAERGRIARDLHDVVLQDLTYALQTVQSSLEEVQNTELDEVAASLQRSIHGLRSAVYDLRPEAPGEEAFARSVESLVELNRQMNPECEIELKAGKGLPGKLPETLGRELLRILQEAMTNARRHSGARRVWVAIGVSGAKLRAEVTDDGRGFGPERPAGIGIEGMRERTRALGGDLRIDSKPGEGTKVRFEVAFAKDREEPEEEARILLVEDHASFRQAAASVFERAPGFTVVGQAGSLSEARRMLDGVDVAIVDLTLPDGYGGALIGELRDANPRAIALVLSASLDRAEVARAVESGAAGVLHKSAGMDEVVEAVRRLRAGETLLSLEEVVKLLRLAGSRREQEHEAHQAIAQLTPREKEVLRAFADGLDSQEIASRLGISLQTERNHASSILAKLGVHSRLQALVFTLRHGVVSIRR